MEKSLDPKEALILERSLRLFKYLFLNEPQPPFKLILTPTDRCNLNCIFCPNFVAREKQRFRAEDEMSDDEWLDIITHGVKLGVRQWCFLGGGEPLLRRDIILPALEKIKKGSEVIDLEIITNGTLLTEEIIRGLVETCKEMTRKNGEEKAAIQTTISIHGKNKSYQEITGVDLYDKVIENVKLISKLKGAYKLKHPIIQINIVVNKKNLTEIEDLISTLANIGVDQIALHPIHVYDETKYVIKNITPSSEDYKLIVEIAKKGKSKFLNCQIDALSLTSYFQQLDSGFKDERDKTTRESITSDPRYEKYEFFKFRCFEPWYDMLINPDGRVGRCAAFATRKEPINVRKESLESIWFGSFLDEVRENIKKGVIMEGCSPCALMSNTIVLREELRKLIDIGLKHNVDRIKEIEKIIEEFYLHLNED